MKIVVAPDKFKGSLSANEVCASIEKGIKKLDEQIEVLKVPLADGGEGTLGVIESLYNPIRVKCEVLDPLSRPIEAYYLKSNNTAFIEMAKASGLQLLKKKERNPLYTTTYGTGQLIKDALDRGVSEMYLMIGGSATNDGGIGMAQALGYSFKDRFGGELLPVGESLTKIQKVIPPIDTVSITKCKVTVLTDVQNPLFGEDGASRIYGPQKGASYKEVELLDNGLEHLAKVMGNANELMVGTGAAGGLGYGAMSFLGADLRSGIEVLLEISDFKKLLKNTDLIITGEGKFDEQTLSGKVIFGVSQAANQNNIPYGILCGVQDDFEIKDMAPVFVDEVSRLSNSFQDSMKNASTYLTELAAQQLAAFIKS